jgi:hypothetical protein
LRASWLEESIPIDPEEIEGMPTLTDLAGHEPEVDFVLTTGEKRIPLEVKYRRRIDAHRDALGFRSFLERTHYNAPFAILVTMHDNIDVPDPRVIAVPLRSLLLLR